MQFFKPLKYSQEQCGKKVANSKRKYTWIFDLDSERYQLELYCSFISGKKTVIMNSTLLHQSKNYSMKFQFECYIGQHKLRIVQNISYFSFYVDGTEFITLLKLNHEKSKQRRQQQLLEQNNKTKQKSGILGRGQVFCEFQVPNNNEQKSVAHINFSDLDNFHSDNKQEQIIEIELNDQNKQQQIDIQESGKLKYFDIQPSNEIKINQQERNIEYQQQSYGMFQAIKSQKKAYIPTPKQIFEEKKAQLFKFLKL